MFHTDEILYEIFILAIKTVVPIVGGAHSRLEVLASIRKHIELAIRSKLINSTPA